MYVCIYVCILPFPLNEVLLPTLHFIVLIINVLLFPWRACNTYYKVFFLSSRHSIKILKKNTKKPFTIRS